MDEILFKNRNKEYGAYKIRKKYNITLAISLLISSVFISACALIPLLLDVKQQYTENFILSKTIVVEMIKLEKVDLPEEKPPKQQAAPAPPKLEEKTKERTETEIAPLENRKDSLQVKLEKKETEESDDETIDGNNLFSFKNRRAFSQWVDENYNRSLLEDFKFKGTIVLRFTVNERGFVDSAKVIEGLAPDLDEEATRVVLNSPRWKPFVYNGQRRRMEYVIPININKNSSN
jgi:protein TonB